MSLPESASNSSPPADRYLQLWHVDQPDPDLAGFLAAFPQLSGRLLADVLLVDQQLRWQRGDRPCVEKYLNDFPAIEADQNLVVDLVYGEWRIRHREEATKLREEYVTRFPHLGIQLTGQINVWEWLCQSVGKASWDSQLP